MPRPKSKTPATIAYTRPKTAQYSPNPINVWGMVPRDLLPFTFIMIRSMLWDPMIRLGLAMRSAPLHNIEFAYQSPDDPNQWIPGVKCQNEEVGAWVYRQYRHIWKHDLGNLLKDQIWGWSGGEVLWKRNQTTGLLDIDKILTRHPSDIRALEADGNIWGVRFRRVPQSSAGHLDIKRPNAYWHGFFPEDGSRYGVSILRGAYNPWSDKWLDGCALDVRRLFMHKDAYGGTDVSYPPGTTEILPAPGTTGQPEEIPNGDVARQMVEQVKAGGVTSRPSMYDEHGNELWKITRATVPANPVHILQYPKDLDVEMLRGMEIPDDILTSGLSGAWEGKKVPQTAFYTGLDRWAHSHISAIDTMLIREGVLQNFGKAWDYEVSFKPLAEQAAEQQKSDKNDDQGQQRPGDRPQRDPYLDANTVPQNGQQPAPGQIRLGVSRKKVAAALVGEGILGAEKLVRAVRREMNQRAGEARKSGRVDRAAALAAAGITTK